MSLRCNYWLDRQLSTAVIRVHNGSAWESRGAPVNLGERDSHLQRVLSDSLALIPFSLISEALHVPKDWPKHFKQNLITGRTRWVRPKEKRKRGMTVFVNMGMTSALGPRGVAYWEIWHFSNYKWDQIRAVSPDKLQRHHFSGVHHLNVDARLRVLVQMLRYQWPMTTGTTESFGHRLLCWLTRPIEG